MDYAITQPRKRWLGGGFDLEVEVRHTPEEHRAIRENRITNILILEREPKVTVTTRREDLPSKLLKDVHGNVHEAKRWKDVTERVEKDQSIYYQNFYGRRTSWTVSSIDEAKQFAEILDQGFGRVKELLASNMAPPDEVYEDFRPTPFNVALVPDSLWREHTYIMAESGGGKTQLLQTIYLQRRLSPNPPGFVIVDSQNRMLPLIAEKFPDVVHIDPQQNPPSLDLFNPGTLGNAGAFNQVLETFAYLFEAGQQPLTPTQRTVFDKGVALMFFGYPSAFGRTATIEDFEGFFQGRRRGRDFLLGADAEQAVAALPAEQQAWYRNEFSAFEPRCQEVRQRLTNLFGEHKPLRALFRPGNPLDLEGVLERGGTVLINTNAGYLGDAAAAFFGRFFIKLLEQQMHRRDEHSRQLFFMVDEVQEYFDQTLVRFLDQARKRNISCIFAHQRLSQIRDEALTAALTGVAVLMATNVTRHDEHAIAGLFNTDIAFIREQKRNRPLNPTYADFALLTRGKEEPSSVRLDFGQLEQRPTSPPSAPRSAPPPRPSPSSAPSGSSTGGNVRSDAPSWHNYFISTYFAKHVDAAAYRFVDTLDRLGYRF